MKKKMIVIALLGIFVWLFPIWLNVLLATIYLLYKSKGLYNKWIFKKKSQKELLVRYFLGEM